MTLERNGSIDDSLTLGAQRIAAGRTLGLTDDETLSLLAQTDSRESARKARMDERRASQRSAYRSRGVQLTPEQADALRSSGIDPRTLGQGETDLSDDTKYDAFGLDQSELQNRTTQDKDYRSGSSDLNTVTFYNNVTGASETLSIPSNLPTAQFLEALDDSGYDALTIKSIKDAIVSRAQGSDVDAAKYRRSGSITEPKSIASGNLVRIPGTRYPQLFERTESGGAGAEISKAAAERRGVPTVRKYQVPPTREVRGRDVGGGKEAGSDAARRLTAALERGEITLDTPVPQQAGEARYSSNNKTVGDLLESLNVNFGGAVAAARDRNAGIRAVAENRRIAAGNNPLTTELKRRENERLAGVYKSGLEGYYKPGQANLDNMPEIIPGRAVYVRHEGTDNAMALELEPGTMVAVDDQNSANVGGMQRVKLNDFQTVNPNDPKYWREPDLPTAEKVVGYEGTLRYIDERGATLGDETVEMAGEATANSPDTRQLINAPANPTTVRELAAATLIQRQSAERMRQVGINPALDALMSKYGAWAAKTGAEPMAAPRSFEDLENMVAQAKGAGGTFYSYNPQSPGRSKKTKAPTDVDILANTFRMSPDETGNLMQALTMLETARDTKVPLDRRAGHERKEAFYEGGRGPVPGANAPSNTVAGVTRVIPDTKPVHGVDPTADPAVLGRNALHHIGTMSSRDRVQVGVDEKGEPVRMEVGPQLRQLAGSTLSDVEAGEAAEVLAAARSNQQGTFADEPPAPVIKGPIKRRSRRDVIRGAVDAYKDWGKEGDTEGILRKANRDMRQEAAIRRSDKRAAARQEARAADDSRVTQALSDERALRASMSARANEAAEMKARAIYDGIANKVQPVQQAPIPPSIAPEPAVPTGNQPVPTIDAGRPTPSGVVADTTIRQPRGQGLYEFATSPRYQRGRRIAAGVGAVGAGTAGLLAALSNMGNKEQEQY